MQTTFRAFVLLVSILCALFASVRYGPASFVQPIAKLVVEKADQMLGDSRRVGAIKPAFEVAASTTQLELTEQPASLRLRAKPEQRHDDPMPSLGAPPLIDEFEDLTAITPITGNDDNDSSQAADVASVIEQFKRLGVVRHDIRPWGHRRQLFRCTCQLSLDPGSGVIRHFEAVDSNPVSAANRVLAEIESWRATRPILVTAKSSFL